MTLATGVLALLVAGAFILLVSAVTALRDATEREARAKDVSLAALRLEKRVLDLETGLRGYVLTARPAFLQAWRRALRELPPEQQRFLRLAERERSQRGPARALVRRIDEYRFDYAQPLVGIARDDPAAARTGVAAMEGKQYMDEIRRRFASFLVTVDAEARASARSANDEARRAVTLGLAGLIACVLLVALYGGYLSRRIGRPLREAAAGASRLAAGDLSTRLDEHGPGEVGELRRAFNAMAQELDRRNRELEQQNVQLRRSERAKSELVSIVSHELRTPLAGVLGFTSLLLQRELDAGTRRRYLEIIDAHGRRLSALLDDFLEVQRLEEGTLELRREPVDLAAVAREQAELFRGQSERHTLDLVLPERLPVSGDESRLAQVLANILSNAIKYSPDGGIVEVRGRHENGVVRVDVRDEGLGIPAEIHDRIGTKFFRGSAAESGIPGTGLGLAIARAIVEAHGGHLGFSSAAESGSTFWVELPAEQAG